MIQILYVILFFNFLLLINSLLGQHTADKVAESVTDFDDFIVPNDDKAEDPPSLSADKVICAFLRDSGFLYFFEGEAAWHVFLGRTMTAKLRCGEAEPDGVRIYFESLGPTSKELATCSIIQKHIQELHFVKSEASFFVSSPRPLSMDRSLPKSEHFPSTNPRWYVITFPWKDSEAKRTFEFDPFLFEKE